MSIERLPLKPNGHVFQHTNEVDAVHLLDNVKPLITGVEHACAVCDRWPRLRVIADAVHVQDTCPYPDGITTTITLQVPSGKLLVSDDLRPVYDWSGTTTASYNTTLGQAQAVHAMAAIGCAYGPASSFELGLYRTGPDSYVIATLSYDEDDRPSLPEDTRLAKIYTDLWAYSCADLEGWIARGGDPSKLEWSDTVVDVPPGTYRFIHHSGERSFDGDSPDDVIWAHVERIA